MTSEIVTMATKASVRPVLLSGEQMERLRQMQEHERQKSPLGIAPSLHDIARGLVDKALEDMPPFNLGEGVSAQ